MKPLVDELMDERHNPSMCVCLIEIEVWRKMWDKSKKAKISSGLLKLKPFSFQLAGVVDLEEKHGNAYLKRDIYRANAADAIAPPTEELVKSAIKTASLPQNLQKIQKNFGLTPEQAKVSVAFREVSTDARGGDSLPIMVVQGTVLFRCIHASLKEALFVCPSVRPTVPIVLK